MTAAQKEVPLSILVALAQQPGTQGALWTSLVPWGESLEPCPEVGWLPSPSSYSSALWP